ncbi:MAG TPA: hypothetical protein VIK00_02865 [Candidatus Limnocylindrales bacterium]
MPRTMVDRFFPWLLILLILAGAFFGLAPFLIPVQFAQFFGFVGVDLFVYRIAGAATFGYAVGLALGYRASWAELRVPIAATAVFNLGSLFACFLAIAGGNTQWVVYLILAASLVFSTSCLYYLARPPQDRPATNPALDRPLATWVVGLFAIGALAALFFGIATLALGGSSGRRWALPAWTASSIARAARRRSARASAACWFS